MPTQFLLKKFFEEPTKAIPFFEKDYARQPSSETAEYIGLAYLYGGNSDKAYEWFGKIDSAPLYHVYKGLCVMYDGNYGDGRDWWHIATNCDDRDLSVKIYSL